MKALRGQSQFQYHNIACQNRIQSALQISQTVSPCHRETDDLSLGVDPAIGTPCTDYPCLAGGNSLQCPLDLPLNSPPVRLHLETEKVCTVVLDLRPERLQPI
jgi:hypothetical protein